MGKKKRTDQEKQMQNEFDQLLNETPKKKKWTNRELKVIKPITDNQANVFHAWYNGLNVCTYGFSGTGKSLISLYLALQAVLERREQNRVIIVRSVVPTRQIGYLPGTAEDKVALYEIPYKDICYELLGKPSSYDELKDCGVVEFMTTSFVRGLTWDNAVVVVEEVQNYTAHEINSIMTRLGNNSRVIVNGDIRQTDLETKKNGEGSGFNTFINIIKNMKEFDAIEFTVHDIVRSPLVKSWIVAYENLK